MLKVVRSPFITTGTINVACLSYVSQNAARVPAKCFGMALMAVVQAVSCVLWKHLQSESPLEHEGCIIIIAAPKCVASTSPIRPHHPNPPVLLADLGGLMNAKVLHIRAQT